MVRAPEKESENMPARRSQHERLVRATTVLQSDDLSEGEAVVGGETQGGLVGYPRDGGRETVAVGSLETAHRAGVQDQIGPRREVGEETSPQRKLLRPLDQIINRRLQTSSFILPTLPRFLVGGGNGEGVYDCGCVSFDDVFCGAGLFFNFTFFDHGLA